MSGERRINLSSILGVGILLIICAFYFVAFLGVESNDNGPSLIRVNESGRIKLSKAVRIGDWITVVRILGTFGGKAIHRGSPARGEYAAPLAMDELLRAGRQAVPTIIDYGLQNEDYQIRYMSMLVIGALGRRQDVGAIREAIRKEKDIRVLGCGAEALCLLGEFREARPIVHMILSTGDPGPIYGNRLIGARDYTDVHHIADYLDRRFKLAVMLNGKYPAGWGPIDIDRFPTQKEKD